MLANLSDLPPLYITACEFDPLLNDSERLAERAKSAGVDREFRVWKRMPIIRLLARCDDHISHIPLGNSASTRDLRVLRVSIPINT